MWSLARKILLHDRVRFVIAATGVSVSVMLILVQVGLYFGFMENASNLIDHSTADLWVAGEGSQSFEFAAAMDERVYYRVLSTPGVQRAERVVMSFSQFKLQRGGGQGVEVLGLERGGTLLRPWNVVAGDGQRINEVDGIVVDRSELAKLDLDGLNDRREILGTRARVVGLTEGIRSFTASPIVFTNLRTARTYTRLRPTQLQYIMVTAVPGADLVALRGRLRQIPHVTAYLRAELSAQTRAYWSRQTGVGNVLFMTAMLGVLVGMVIVGQILYTGTLEHLREYGTLKAMGARNGAVVQVILCQAMLYAALGYVVGSGLGLLVRASARAANLAVVMGPGLFLGTAALTAILCAAASVLSIVKVLRLDPATVFKG